MGSARPAPWSLDYQQRPLSVSPTDAPERDVIVWMDHRAVDDPSGSTPAGMKFCAMWAADLA
jgi:ribulose kinase